MANTNWYNDTEEQSREEMKERIREAMDSTNESGGMIYDQKDWNIAVNAATDAAIQLVREWTE